MTPDARLSVQFTRRRNSHRVSQKAEIDESNALKSFSISEEGQKKCAIF
jgi:hypothetical protein